MPITTVFIASSPSPPTLGRLFALFCLLGAVRLLAGVFIPAWRPRKRRPAGKEPPGAAVPLSALACAGTIPFQLALGTLALTEAGDVPAWRPWRVWAMVAGGVLLAVALLYEWLRTRGQIIASVEPTPALERASAAGNAGPVGDARPPP